MPIVQLDLEGETALDYVIEHDQLAMVRFLTSMGASIYSAMDRLLEEVQQRERERERESPESQKRKRDVDSTETCLNGQRRSFNVAWEYGDTEASELAFLREDVAVICENNQLLACVLPPETVRSAAKRVRRSALPPQERYVNVSSVCVWERSGTCRSLFSF